MNDKDLFTIIENGMGLAEIELVNYSPLTLAYIGDAVYEVVIRTMVVGEANKSVNKLHKDTANLVKAESQSAIIKLLMEELTQAELGVYKRGRNAKSFTRAKNASMSDYRTATGFEALVGYLYLSKQTERMLELIKLGVDRVRSIN